MLFGVDARAPRYSPKGHLLPEAPPVVYGQYDDLIQAVASYRGGFFPPVAEMGTKARAIAHLCEMMGLAYNRAQALRIERLCSITLVKG